MSFYRIQPAGRDTALLLDESTWQSAQWNGHDDEDIRRGVSTCASIDDLVAYYRLAGGDPDGCVLVELAGSRADVLDHDHEAGAVLIYPSAILSVTPVPADILDRIYA